MNLPKLQRLSSVKDAYHSLQKIIRSASFALPQMRGVSIGPLLTSAQPFGYETERFRNSSQSLVPWNDKQSQIWRIQGCLKTDGGRPLGFQLHFFDWRLHRNLLGLLPAALVLPNLRAAHFTITDPIEADQNQTFHFNQKGGVLAKNKEMNIVHSFHLEQEGWYIFQSDAHHFQLYAEGLHLNLEIEKPLVLHGQNGYNQYGSRSEDSFFHCSYTRLKATGRFLHQGRLSEVKGSAWIDHKKTTSHTGIASLGYDGESAQWNLQFDSNEELIVWQFQSGKICGATWIDNRGDSHHLIQSEISIEIIENWISPKTNTRYPLRSKIEIPKLGIQIEIKPTIQQQELEANRSTMTHYWSGLVSANGTRGGQAIQGQGFLTLEGYDRWIGSKLIELLTRQS